MKKLSFLTTILFCFILFMSCRKNSSLNGAGISVVQFPDSVKINSYLIVPDEQLLNIVDIARDIPSEAALNSTQTVYLKLDSTVIDDYDSANSATYTVLSDTVYKFDSSNLLVNGFIKVTFKPGEFFKSIKIRVKDLSLLVPNKALGFKIDSSDLGTNVSVQYKKAFVAIGPKNQYEAKYKVNGYFYHPALPRAINRTKDLATVNATTFSMGVGDLSGYTILFKVNGDNSVSVILPHIGSFPGVSGDYQLFPSLPSSTPGYVPPTPVTASDWSSVFSDQCTNYYDTTTKTFYLRYGYVGGTGYRVIEEILTRQ
jgi:hypothetical protein